MTIDQVAELLRSTMWTTLVVASPLLGVALIVGLGISVFQAATQINEQTLTFVPKIVLVLGTFAVLFPWILRSVVDFGTTIIGGVLRGGAP